MLFFEKPTARLPYNPDAAPRSFADFGVAATEEKTTAWRKHAILKDPSGATLHVTLTWAEDDGYFAIIEGADGSDELHGDDAEQLDILIP